jgi:hypothetical protein
MALQLVQSPTVLAFLLVQSPTVMAFQLVQSPTVAMFLQLGQSLLVAVFQVVQSRSGLPAGAVAKWSSSWCSREVVFQLTPPRTESVMLIKRVASMAMHPLRTHTLLPTFLPSFLPTFLPTLVPSRTQPLTF